jgi:guanylate kinase
VSDSASQAARGRLLVVAAPSGAGKTSLVHALLERRPTVRFSVSYTTRPPRAAEVHGQDYFFVSEDEFQRMVRADEFLEHACVFDHWYGTSRAHVEALMSQGYSVLLEIDWQGAAQVRARAPDATTIFILPPGATELERRLRARATDTDATIERRLRDARGDMAHWGEFDYVIVNDDFERAVNELERIAAGEGGRNDTRSDAVRRRIETLLAE